MIETNIIFLLMVTNQRISKILNIFEAKFYFIYRFYVYFLSPLIMFRTDFNICFVTIAVNDMNNNS